MQEFISRYAKEKLKKLQRGSVKGFNLGQQADQVAGVFDVAPRRRSRKSCRSGTSTPSERLVDDRFREYFPAANLNDEYRMTLR